MAFTVSDDMIWATYVFFTALFSLLAMWFPLRLQGSWKSPAGEVWTHLRAMIFPFLAAAMWYQMAGLSLTDYADVGSFFYFCESYRLLPPQSEKDEIALLKHFMSMHPGLSV